MEIITDYVNSKPTILSGTADPTSADGKDGDIYIKYEAPSAESTE